MKLLQVGIAALLVLLCFGGVSAIETVDFAVYLRQPPSDMPNVMDVEVLPGEISRDTGARDVATFPFGGTITESQPSRTFQFAVPPGVYNSIQVDMKFYQVDGKWSDLRLKLVDSSNCVLAQDDGPWIFENGERHVRYDHRLQEGDTYWIVVEKISLVGDTWFGGTVKLQT